MAKSNTSHSAKTAEQVHYENISSFFKWGIGISGSIIAAIAAFAIYLSYSDRKAMREEYTTAISDLKSEMKDLKMDAKQSVYDIKSDAKETATTIKNDSRESLKNTQEYADKEISKIKFSTNEIAMREAQKQIENIFATDKIQNLIENQAVKEIKSKVMGIVNTATSHTSKINDAAARMRIGHPDGMRQLKLYFEKATDRNDSLMAKSLYEQICLDYYTFRVSDTAMLGFFPIHILENKMPSVEKEKKELIDIVKKINEPDESLDWIAIHIIELSRLTGVKFRPFEIKEINEWFNALKK